MLRKARNKQTENIPISIRCELSSLFTLCEALSTNDFAVRAQGNMLRPLRFCFPKYNLLQMLVNSGQDQKVITIKDKRILQLSRTLIKVLMSRYRCMESCIV